MKKLLLTAVMSFLYVTSASADLGVNVGASAQLGVFSASGNESDTGTSLKKDTGSETAAVGWGSVFLEVTMADRVMVGIDYVPSALSSDTVTTAKSDMGVGAQAQTTVENKVQVDFEDLMTAYAGIMLTENLYVKAGIVQVDVQTNETMATGAKYADTDMDGSMVGIGYHNVLDNGIFFRVEGTYMDLGGLNLTSTGTASTSKVTINSLDGASGKLSIGKSF
jgi:hypothetical protein